MDLQRLLSLLHKGALWLSRLDQLGDPWEGHLPRPIAEAFKERLEGAPYGPDFLRFTRELRYTFFANCWHASPHESAALWSIYSGDSGIAIKSDVRRLKRSCRGISPFYIGMVKYIDFESLAFDPRNAFNAAFHKRHSFEHEKEVRIMASHFPAEATNSVDWSKFARLGIELSIDIPDLVTGVQVAPTAPNWQLDAVRELFKRFGLEAIPVSRSALNDPVVY